MRLIDADELILSLNDNYLANSPVGNETLDVKSYRESVCEGLEMAMKTVEEAPTVAKDTNVPNKWISVKDMYPRKGQTVIALLSYTSTHIEYEIAEFNGKYFDADDAYLPSQLVTHWMPLPELPEEVDGDERGLTDDEKSGGYRKPVRVKVTDWGEGRVYATHWETIPKSPKEVTGDA